jgi:hypothetical protein
MLGLQVSTTLSRTFLCFSNEFNTDKLLLSCTHVGIKQVIAAGILSCSWHSPNKQETYTNVKDTGELEGLFLVLKFGEAQKIKMLQETYL